jgi:asparagine synthase (glutamine-hydrolysing)
MQTMFGYISKNDENEISNTYFKRIASVSKIKTFRFFHNKHLGYGIENNPRVTFTETFSFSAVKMILAGDFIRKDELVRKIRSYKKEYVGPENVYDALKAEISQLIKTIDGVFCIVLFDTGSNSVTVFSDQHGIMPIYYFYDSRLFLFGTSIKCIIACPGFLKQVNSDSIFELFKLGFTIPPSTLFKGISMLMPGEMLDYNGELKISRINEPEIYDPVEEELEHLVHEYYACLRSSITDILTGFKNCTLLLSGGIDSAAIAAILSKISNIKLDCLTIDLNPVGDFESKGAQRISALFGLSHRIIDKTAGDLVQQLTEAIWHYEAPVYNGITEYILTRNIGKEADIVLTGDGNDLIWGITGICSDRHLKERRVCFDDYYLKFRSCINDYLLDVALLRKPDKSMLSEKLNRAFIDTGNFYNDFLYADQKLFGSSCACNVVGKLRVGPSEALFRFPYLSKKIENLVNSLPVEYKIGNNDSEPVCKYLFKTALSHAAILPYDIIHTQKRWMPSPAGEWLRYGLKDCFEKLVFKSDSSLKNYFRMTLIKDMWTLHQLPKNDYSYFLMMVLTFEIWHKMFIESCDIQAY